MAGWVVLELVAIVSAVVVDVIVMTVVTGVGHSRSNSYVTAILTSFIFRHRFHTMRPKFLKFKRN